MSRDASSYVQPVIPGLEAYASSAPSDAQRQLALNEARAQVMEDLYQASGRADPEHPMHATFTGLWADFCLAAGRQLLEHALLNPDQVRITAKPVQPPTPPAEAPIKLTLEQARTIREHAHADAAESIRLQQAADVLRASYFRGLAALDDDPEASPFASLGVPAVRR